jgi:uncharacterized membrane protein
MTPSFFITSLTVLLIVLLLRKKICNMLNNIFNLPNEHTEFEIKTEWIVYILAALLTLLMIYGMVMGVTDNPFGNVSVGGGIENLEHSPSKQPHRLFDINFDIFK